MKYWRGFLVAFIFAAITWALNMFAAGHTALVDMVYPYMTRLIIGTIAHWSSNFAACLWQTALVILALGVIASLALVILRKGNLLRWLGWVLAVAMGINMCSTLLYGLNEYASPVSQDVRLDMTDYTVSELVEATGYYRDQANALASKVSRNGKGEVELPAFDELANQAGDGFAVMTYDKAISLFAGTTLPVKKLGWTVFYGGTSGVTSPLTGEACVNPNVPSVALPFAMCKEMAKRMTVYHEEDAKYAGFLAAEANPSQLFQYSAYLVAYYHCYNTLLSVNTSTAQQSAMHIRNATEQLVLDDMNRYEKFFGKLEAAAGDTMADLLTCQYIQQFITPLHIEEEDPFDPKDLSKLDLTYVKPTPTPLQDKEKPKTNESTGEKTEAEEEEFDEESGEDDLLYDEEED